MTLIWIVWGVSVCIMAFLFLGLPLIDRFR